jgi:hypothetical protein
MPKNSILISGMDRVNQAGKDTEYFNSLVVIEKDKSRYICPNTIYVALTRCLEHLVVLHSHKNEYFKFLDTDSLDTICNFEQDKELKYTPSPTNSKKSDVTELTRHLPEEVISNCLDFIKIKQTVKPQDSISFPTKVKQTSDFGDDLWENVCEMNGIVVPMFYGIKNGKMILDDTLQMNSALLGKDTAFKELSDEFKSMLNYWKNICKSKENVDLPALLKFANFWSACKSGLVFKTKQITNYNWLEQDKVNICIDRMSEKINNNAIYEILLMASEREELHERVITGFADCITNNTLWEFKCVSKLENEHLLQLAIYMYLHKLFIEEQIIKIKNSVAIDSTSKKLIKNSATYENKLLDIVSKIQQCENGFKVGDIYDNIKIVKLYKNDVVGYSSNNTRKITKVNKNVLQYNILEDLKKQQLQCEIILEKCTNDNKVTDDLKQYYSIKLKEYSSPFRYILWNILDNEEIEISCDLEDLKKMMYYLIDKKYYSKVKDNDTIFMEKMQRLQG